MGVYVFWLAEISFIKLVEQEWVKFVCDGIVGRSYAFVKMMTCRKMASGSHITVRLWYAPDTLVHKQRQCDENVYRCENIKTKLESTETR